MQLTEEDSELIPFSNAAFRVYTQITGGFLSPLGGSVVNAVLHEVAQAIASVATVHGARTDTEPLKPLTALELEDATFQCAATVVRTSSGIKYGRLYIRRGDVRSAVSILKRTGARFASCEDVGRVVEPHNTLVGDGERQASLV